MNRAAERKYHYIYKITRDDGKYYIGLHSTDNLEDGYFGSGQRLWKSIKKHGKNKHAKEILEFLPSRKELRTREAELVDSICLADPLCLNLALGGKESGFYGTSSEDRKRWWTDERREKRGELSSELWKDPAYKEKVLASRSYWHPSEEHIQNISTKNKAHWDSRSPEERNTIAEKISEACKEKCADPVHMEKVSAALKEPWKDPEYRTRMSLRNKGSIFVVNRDGCKGIWPEQLEEYLALGYVRGRKLRN